MVQGIDGTMDWSIENWEISKESNTLVVSSTSKFYHVEL